MQSCLIGKSVDKWYMTKIREAASLFPRALISRLTAWASRQVLYTLTFYNDASPSLTGRDRLTETAVYKLIFHAPTQIEKGRNSCESDSTHMKLSKPDCFEQLNAVVMLDNWLLTKVVG